MILIIFDLFLFNLLLQKLLKDVHDSFILYLNDNSLLCDAQSGFRKYNSCFTCLAKMINDWHENINNGCLVGCITLDFRKAFDVLSHEILIQKLALYGCDDISPT